MTAALTVFVLSTGCSKQMTSPIRLNQVGYSPLQEKTATIVLPVSDMQSAITDVFIVNEKKDTVWRGTAEAVMVNPVSGKPSRFVDFSDLNEPGKYTLVVYLGKGKAESMPFIISEQPYRELTRQALRAFYHQRASMATEEPFAEGYARAAGHPDDYVIVHQSAATTDRPEGTVISSPGGWYDAGDYNKYIVNSGFTMGVWLMAYEFNRTYFDTLALNIPESASAGTLPHGHIPDMLAEAMYNLRWMLTMQDTDGGVYHKLTEPDFEGFIAPHKCHKPRYVVMKTTAATLDFAASMALAARVYEQYDADFCKQAKEAALRAYEWAQANPDVYYDQPKMNEQFKPEITTGAYDDFDVRDEFYWAATELYLLTGDEMFKQQALTQGRLLMNEDYAPAVWGKVTELANIEWILHSDEQIDFALECQDALLSHLSPYIDEAETVSVFRSPYGNSEADFFWGCNSEGCCWRGIEFLYAYRISNNTDKRWLVNAERCLDYILGQNATGYCYVTGFGSHPSCHPHHRLSYSHPKGTLPGFLVGGPNPAKQDAVTDGVRYPKDIAADECYLDKRPSYATNEVTINWNVTLFALAAGIDALN